MKSNKPPKLIYRIRFFPALILLIFWPLGGAAQGISEGGRLINDSWFLFSGKDGIVNEEEAIRQAKKGVEITIRDGLESTRSIGMNNLGVIYACAYDKKLRNTNLGKKLINEENGKNKFSTDNYIWNVYKRDVPVNEADFLVMLKAKHNNHEIWKYINLNSNNLPRNQKEAYKILENSAKNGDWIAAQRLAYIYECDLESLDLKNSTKWMKIAHQNALKNSVDGREISNIQNRLNRYYILDKNTPRKYIPTELYSR
jgi:hypothetical protein